MQGGGYGYGPPVPAYGPPPKKSLAPWIALGALALLLLFAGIGAAAVYFLVLAKPSPHLAHFVPSTTSVYVEMPGFQRSVLSAAGMKPLDSSRIDEKQMQSDLVTAFVKSFSLSQDDARAVVTSLDSSAFAARDTNGATKAAVLIAFSNGTAEKLLHSLRFSDAGPFLSGGEKYALERRPFSEVSPNAGLIERGLSEMRTDHGKEQSALVWFPKKKLLVFGDDALVTDIATVLDGTADSLEKNEAYKKAKRTFESGSDVAFFFDTHDLDDTRTASGRKLLEGYLKNRDPVTGAIKIVKAGVMMDMHVTLSGPSLPPDDLIAPAPKLALPRRLPADTIAYMALSTKTKMPGAAVLGTLLRMIAENDPAAAKDVRAELDAMETSLGFKLDDIIDLTGDEGAIGIVLDPAFKLDTTNGLADELGSVGLVYALMVKDDAKAKAVLAKIRAQLETPQMASVAKVTSIGADGWEVDPETPATFPVPNLTVKYDGKQIVAVVGGPALTARAFAALQTGKDTLASNPTHELAFGAMPQDANLYMWLDTGRITSVMLDGATHVRRSATSLSLPIDAVRLTGPDRVTTAFALRATVKSGVWSVDVDSLNMPATALFSVAKDLDIGGAIPRGDLFAPHR
jgi:hypothetical protein